MFSHPIITAYFFSQLVYLDIPAGIDKNVGSLARYYIENPSGRQKLQKRFERIPREYERWVEFLSGEAQQYGDWVIDSVYDDNSRLQSGFYGCAFYAPHGGDIVVAFRGSELLGDKNHRNDYENDLALCYKCPVPQQTMVDAYWRRFGHNFHGKLLVTGHSLGGNLAAYGAVNAPGYIKTAITGCYAFNAPGFCPDFFSQHEDSIAEMKSRLHLPQNEFDPVSSLLLQVTQPDIIASNHDPAENSSPAVSDYFYPHSNFAYQTDSNGNFIPARTGEKSELCKSVAAFSNMILGLPVRMREGLAAAILAAIYDTRAGAGTANRVLRALTSYLSHSGRVLTGDFFDLTKTLYSAEMFVQQGSSLPASGSGPEKAAALLTGLLAR